MDMTNQPTIPFETPTEPPTKIFEISGETAERVGLLQDDVIAWTFEGGVWWITDTAGGITGYNLAKFVWLSITPKED